MYSERNAPLHLVQGGRWDVDVGMRSESRRRWRVPDIESVAVDVNYIRDIDRETWTKSVLH